MGDYIMKETEVKTTTNFDLAVDMLDRMYCSAAESVKKGGERTNELVEALQALDYTKMAFEQHDITEEAVSKGMGASFSCMRFNGKEEHKVAEVHIRYNGYKITSYIVPEGEEKVEGIGCYQINAIPYPLDGDKSSVKTYGESQEKIYSTKFDKEGKLLEAPAQVQ